MRKVKRSRVEMGYIPLEKAEDYGTWNFAQAAGALLAGVIFMTFLASLIVNIE